MNIIFQLYFFHILHPCRGSGTVNSLAIITTPEEEQTLLVSEYTDFLNSSILVTGGFLISSQPCSVEGMSIGVNSSIRETDTGKLA